MKLKYTCEHLTTLHPDDSLHYYYTPALSRTLFHTSTSTEPLVLQPLELKTPTSKPESKECHQSIQLPSLLLNPQRIHRIIETNSLPQLNAPLFISDSFQEIISFPTSVELHLEVVSLFVLLIYLSFFMVSNEFQSTCIIFLADFIFLAFLSHIT